MTCGCSDTRICRTHLDELLGSRIGDASRRAVAEMSEVPGARPTIPDGAHEEFERWQTARGEAKRG